MSMGPTEDDQPAAPLYQVRRESADANADSGAADKGGARVGGATGPVESAEHGLGAVPTEGDGGVSPSDEQPAGESPEEELTHGTPGHGRRRGAGPPDRRA